MFLRVTVGFRRSGVSEGIGDMHTYYPNEKTYFPINLEFLTEYEDTCQIIGCSIL